jgi:hypothetical protein
MLSRCYLKGGPDLVSKEDGWVGAGYFVVTNAVVRSLWRPSEYVLGPLRPA